MIFRFLTNAMSRVRDIGLILAVLLLLGLPAVPGKEALASPGVSAPEQEPVTLAVVITDATGNPLTDLDPSADDPSIGGGDFFVALTTSDATGLATYAQRIAYNSNIIRYIGLFTTGLAVGPSQTPGDLNVNSQHAGVGASAYLTVSGIGIGGYAGAQTLAKLAFEAVTPEATGTVTVRDEPTSSSPYGDVNLDDIPHTEIGQPALYQTLPGITPSITVDEPNGGEIWPRGTRKEIMWMWTGDVGDDVRIELYKGGSFALTITLGTPTRFGDFNWPIPESLPAGSDYTVRITSTTSPAYFDESDDFFSITTRPVIAIDLDANTVPVDGTREVAPGVTYRGAVRLIDFPGDNGYRSYNLRLLASPADLSAASTSPGDHPQDEFVGVDSSSIPDTIQRTMLNLMAEFQDEPAVIFYFDYAVTGDNSTVQLSFDDSLPGFGLGTVGVNYWLFGGGVIFSNATILLPPPATPTFTPTFTPTWTTTPAESTFTPTPTFTPTWTTTPTESTFTPTPTLSITPTFTPTETPYTPTPTPRLGVFGDLDDNGIVAEATDSLLWSLTWESQVGGPGSYNPAADYEPDGDVDPDDLHRYLELRPAEAPVELPKIVISEFQVRPMLTFETRGEFVELYNNDTVDVDLFGWSLSDDDGDFVIINRHLIISPSEALVLANTMDPCLNGGLDPDYIYPGQGSVHFRLDNSDDEIILLDEQSREIDKVIYRNQWLPVYEGVTFRLLFPGKDNLRVFDPWFVTEFPCEEANWWYSLYDGYYGTGDEFPWCPYLEQVGTPGTYSTFPFDDPFDCEGWF